MTPPPAAGRKRVRRQPEGRRAAEATVATDAAPTQARRWSVWSLRRRGRVLKSKGG
jgi:hypothetical protein